MLRNISRAAVDRYLTVVRKPVDAVLGGRNGERAKSLGVTLDRADATARSVAGTALRDPELKDDARRRREAADERASAQRLRGVGEAHAQQAERKAANVKDDLDDKRERAARESERKKQQSEKRKQAAKKKAAARARARKSAAERAAAENKAEVAKRSKREKLAELEVKEDALEKEEEAVASAAESKRLADAAAAAKAKRKGGSGT